MSSFFNHFKNKITSYHKHAIAEKNEDINNSSNSRNLWNSITKLYPKSSTKLTTIPKYSEYNRFAEDSWDSTDNNWDSNSTNHFPTGSPFFIEMEREHFGLLDAYVFASLANIVLESKTTTGNVLGEYEDNIPTSHLPEAILHAKKDGIKLDKYIEDFRKKVAECNPKIKEANKGINLKINEEIIKASYDETNANQKSVIKEIKTWIHHYLKEISKADNVYQSANDMNVNLNATGLDQHAVDLINTVTKNQEILGFLEDAKDYTNELNQILNLVSGSTRPISILIRAKYYNIRADCCPTYWSLLGRFI